VSADQTVPVKKPEDTTYLFKTIILTRTWRSIKK